MSQTSDIEKGDVVVIRGWESLGPLLCLGKTRDRNDPTITGYKMEYLFGPHAGEVGLMSTSTTFIQIQEKQND